MSAAGSVDQVDMGLPASFVWSYDQSSPPVARLYERAKAGQWNAAVDLDWMVDVDPGAAAPPDARGGIDWSQVGGPLTDRLAADRSSNADILAESLCWLGVASEEDFAGAKRERDNRRAKLEVDYDIAARVAERTAARGRKDFATADRIRAELEAEGIQLMDTRDPETGELVTTWEVKR